MYGIDGGTDTVLNFAGIFGFGSSLLTDCKIEVGIFMTDWLFHQRYHCERLFAKKRSETRNVFAMVEYFA